MSSRASPQSPAADFDAAEPGPSSSLLRDYDRPNDTSPSAVAATERAEGRLKIKMPNYSKLTRMGVFRAYYLGLVCCLGGFLCMYPSCASE